MPKPFDLHGLMGYQMKDDIHIFHLVPSKPVSDNLNCFRKVQEKVAWSSEHQKVDISPVLSYSTNRHIIVSNGLCTRCMPSIGGIDYRQVLLDSNYEVFSR